MEETILVTTSTCPNCAKAKEILNDNNIQYKLLLAEDNIDFCKNNNIMQAPTLIVGNQKYTNLSNIIKYIEGTK